MAQPNLGHNVGHASSLPLSEVSHAASVRHAGKFGASPGRLVVVFVLAVVLAVVLYMQFGTSETPTDTTADQHRPTPTVRAPQTANSAKGATKPDGAPLAAKARTWPTIALEEVQRHNPFRLPPSLVPDVEPSVAAQQNVSASPSEDEPRVSQFQQRRDDAFASLRDEGITLVVLGERERVVTIGTRDLRVGDIVDGFKVSEIGPGGVVLVETEQDDEIKDENEIEIEDNSENEVEGQGRAP
jgi:hypothetical protein